jgi:cbb3-type cytochrome oxidase subunit 3
MAVGTEQEYRRRRVVNFVGLWGKIINVTAVVLTIVFVGVSLFFNTMEKDFAAEANNLTIQLNQEKFQELKAKVADFNISLNNIAQANQQVKDWSGFFKWWMDNGGALGIQKFIINSPDSLITFRGWTNTEEKLLDFKSKMENSPNFSEVDVPLASVIKQRNGVEFNLNFRINKLFPETSAITNNEGGILENTIPAEILLETPLISPETKPE